LPKGAGRVKSADSADLTPLQTCQDACARTLWLDRRLPATARAADSLGLLR
jgi:hypothetical protein